ncbi:aminotransferase class V-fold PLP-dependent enzyme [Qipengyuania sp. YG27]|uniref:Cysteine desulfurase n=1 Tax=Qipengyuania mesophila TaxID=2867246 RepID=A0ABS7JWA9_9SPHN|nr:aminotransferase class V-fold PLP-dependent enzyme [Qipengyuania mesophila]
MANRIYLDHAATSPLRPEARKAMEEGFALWANPSSPHAEGRKARSLLEDARERVKATLGWQGEVIFTSGASEALAIGLQRAKPSRQIISPIEHDAVGRAAPSAEILKFGAIPLIDPDYLGGLLSKGSEAVVAIQAVNSETGVIQPMFDYYPITQMHGSLLLCDCSQNAGKHEMPDCDMAVVSAHKLGGPIGIGALLVKDFAMLEPSGGHERGYRQGTENLPGALGFAAALEACSPAYLEDSEGVGDALIDLADAVWNSGGAIVDGNGMTSMFIRAIAMPKMSATAQVMRFDMAGIAVSQGSACSSGTMKTSRVLEAMQVEPEVAANTIRVSLGWNTTREEVERFCEVWLELAKA